MTCLTCKHGETEPGITTVTLERGSTTVIFKHVPAEVCQTCGEAYLEASITRHLLHIVEEAARAGVQVDVRSYAATPGSPTGSRAAKYLDSIKSEDESISS